MMEVVFSESAGGALAVALEKGKPIGGVSAYIGMTKEEQSSGKKRSAITGTRRNFFRKP